MSQYLPVSTEQAGRDLSEALWAVASPVETREARGATTTHYCAVVEDTSGQWWLDIPPDMPLPVSPDVTQAQLDAVVALIQVQEDRIP